mmetsp:Transcript_18520/g.60662  ORF Transcript_18520/g.60662 Transcript_18520/m.60662 type:complete len:213 (+) Transcript_18520:1525-2163(+)
MRGRQTRGVRRGNPDGRAAMSRRVQQRREPGLDRGEAQPAHVRARQRGHRKLGGGGGQFCCRQRQGVAELGQTGQQLGAEGRRQLPQRSRGAAGPQQQRGERSQQGRQGIGPFRARRTASHRGGGGGLYAGQQGDGHQRERLKCDARRGCLGERGGLVRPPTSRHRPRWHRCPARRANPSITSRDFPRRRRTVAGSVGRQPERPDSHDDRAL